jgi:hypothetical protein
MAIAVQAADYNDCNNQAVSLRHLSAVSLFYTFVRLLLSFPFVYLFLLFIPSFFKDVFQQLKIIYCRMKELNNELEMKWKEAVVSTGICLKGQRKTTRNFSQDSRSPGRDLKLGPPGYEAGELTTQA